MAVRDVEAHGTSQADSLHQTHARSIHHLEEQAIQEESKSQLDFLFACHAAIQARPCGTPWHAGSFLPHFDGAGTYVPPI